MKFLKKLKENESDDLNNLGKLKSFSKLDDDSSDKSDDKKENTDLNRQGMIRLVKNAHLVYKRENDTDRFDELWIYKMKENGVYYDIDIKNDILSGTDIPLNAVTSEDGEQTYELWNSGNIVFLKIFNLPN